MANYCGGEEVLCRVLIRLPLNILPTDCLIFKHNPLLIEPQPVLSPSSSQPETHGRHRIKCCRREIRGSVGYAIAASGSN